MKLLDKLVEKYRELTTVGSLDDWIPDNRYPGWVFKLVAVADSDRAILYGKNDAENKAGHVLVDFEGAMKASWKDVDNRALILDNKVTYLVDRASIDPEAWLRKDNG